MVMGSERRREGWMMLVVASLGLDQPSQPRQPSTGDAWAWPGPLPSISCTTSSAVPHSWNWSIVWRIIASRYLYLWPKLYCILNKMILSINLCLAMPFKHAKSTSYSLSSINIYCIDLTLVHFVIIHGPSVASELTSSGCGFKANITL